MLFILRALECLDEICLDLVDPSGPIRVSRSPAPCLESPLAQYLKQSGLTLGKAHRRRPQLPLGPSGMGNETQDPSDSRVLYLCAVSAVTYPHCLHTPLWPRAAAGT